MWEYNGQQRPPFAIKPEPGQESVWDYPRPPALEDCSLPVEVKSRGKIVASSTRCKRVLETASPPTVYMPPEDIAMDMLTRVAGSSHCEWKGVAQYWGLANRPDTPAVAWSYPNPTTRFAAIRDWLSFYPGRIECYIDHERVKPQAGGFYGGWVTASIAGPFKGEPGTSHW